MEMKRSRWLILLYISGFIIFVAGCAAAHKNVNDLAPDTLQSGKSVAVVFALDCADRSSWTGRCAKDSDIKSGGDFTAYPTGVSKAATSIGKHNELQVATAKLDVRNALQASVAEHLKPLLLSNGLNVVSDTENVRTWTLPQKNRPRPLSLKSYYRDSSENDDNRQASVLSLSPNYQSVIERMNTDYLMVIEILQYGIVRQYTPLVSVALEPPTAIAAIRASVHADNVAEPIYNNIVVRSSVPDFEWKVSPDFADLMALPPLVLDAVIKDAANELF